ncbi:Tetraspanin-14 [Pteropus alecto]|uniref:Tetraspanin-14 n=2 Tax=Pteropodidae TaxID=9398 RepID=L5KCT5_PTEAL|nr:Tetraspanin-14 [Pteropus alecto]
MDLVCKETVKKVAWVLIEKHTGLGSDFHSSKRVSQEETTVPSKELRNKVEVYVTHLMKRIQRKWIQKDFMRDPAFQKMHYYRYSNAEVSCWYKYLLFSYNIVFWLAGVAFLGAGLWAWSEKGVLSDLTKVTRLHGIDPVVLVLIVGVVMFTLGFAGCVGALRENICLLKFFCGAIVLIFFLELAVAVLAFLFQDWVRDRFREFFESNIRSYRDDIDLQNLIDSLQKANQCCGAYGPEDWDLNVYFNCSGASYSREKCGVPFSCCVPDPAQKVVNTQCGYDVRTQLKSKWDEFIFTKGCIQALEGWLPRNIYIVAGVFIAISLLQIFGIFLARTLISDIEAVKAGHHF